MHVEQIRAAVAGHPFVMSERELLALAAEPLSRVKAASPDERLEFVFAAMRRMSDDSFSVRIALKASVSAVLRGTLPLSSLDAVKLVEAASERRVVYPFKAILSAVETVPFTPALASALTALRSRIDEYYGGAEMRELHARIDALLNGKPEPGFAAGGAWSVRVLEEAALSSRAAEWRALLLHARALEASSAPRKWLAQAVSLIDAVGPDEFRRCAAAWLALGPTPGLTQTPAPEADAAYQKGLVWAIGAFADSSLAPALGDFALACFRKIPQIGAVCPRAGNACVNALSILPGLSAVAQLSRLNTRVKYDVALRLIEKALAEAAERNHVTRDDLEAMSVPAFDLDAAGLDALLTEASQKKAPADVKKKAKEVEALIAAQRIRLERLLLSNGTTAFASWRQWYLDHPVTGRLARRLIWEFNGTPAIWHETQLIDWAGQPLDPTPETSVRLWHPLRSDVQTVLSWRCWLEDHGVEQPFKQAHREVYLLTGAERETADHSLRFAGHIVKQHQFAALCRERGWQFKLMGQWDSHNTPTLELPRHGLRVELEVDFPHDEDEVSGHAIYLAIRTGALRFMPFDPQAKKGGFEFKHLATLPRTLDEVQRLLPQPRRLEDIDPLVFSEVLRDVDLLISVTSIGADPGFLDERPGGPHADYWREFAFGALTVAAENRKEILSALLPKLAIGGQCRLEGHFLHVRGQLHEYSIHLGSANVMLTPGSRHLCIVTGPGDHAAGVRLPFAGDRVLSIILSKAFLLADDTKIKDESIRRQLEPTH